jgi:hypothetical protein
VLEIIRDTPPYFLIFSAGRLCLLAAAAKVSRGGRNPQGSTPRNLILDRVIGERRRRRGLNPNEIEGGAKRILKKLWLGRHIVVLYILLMWLQRTGRPFAAAAFITGIVVFLIS